jgi:hypothetical protein
LHRCSRSKLRKSCVQACAIHAAVSDYSMGRDYMELLNAFLEVWNRPRDEQHAFLAVSVLQQVHRICTDLTRSPSNEELEATLLVLRVCTDRTLLEAASRSSTAFLLPPVFEAIRVLGVFGSRLSPTTPKHLLDPLAQCFHAVLSSTSWSVCAHAMTSLVQFASTVPPAHKDILPRCLPKNMQKLLQCRLQGLVCGDVASLSLLRTSYSDTMLQGIMAPRHGRDSGGGSSSSSRVFPATTSLTVPMGSYVMTMPTQGGRKAVVIFAPGDDSLQDIRDMLGTAENEHDVTNPSVPWHKLQRVTVLPDGGGCKLRF